MQKHYPLLSLLRGRSQAIAAIRGSTENSCLSGFVRFYQTYAGVVIYSEITGLPDDGNHFFGFHIHEGDSCSGDENDPFSDVGMHYNPGGAIHPYHAGDLPPLLSSQGFALSVFLTDRFCVRDIIGRTVIIHDQPDDFTTQPSGNSGTKIACGTIRTCS